MANKISVVLQSDLSKLISLVAGELKTKVTAETGKGLSSNDFTSAEKSKLAAIAANATQNSTDAYLLARANHTGTQSADTIVDGTANKVLTKALYDKLTALYQTVVDDSLTSTATDHALSAAQGKALKSLIDALDADGDGIADSAADAAKLGGQLPAHYENVLTGIKVNGTAVQLADKAADITVPTNNNQLTNGAGYQTSAQVESAITGKGYQTAAQVETAITGKGYQTAAQVNSLISAAGHLQRKNVDTLPAVADADENTIYLAPAEGSKGGNVRDEYMVFDGAWERIGSTQADMTEYAKTADFTALGDTVVQSLWDTAMSA